MPALLLSILASLFFPSSGSLSYFILAVSMLECLVKHLCVSFTFPIAMLNGTCLFTKRYSPCFGRSFAYQKCIKLNWLCEGCLSYEKDDIVCERCHPMWRMPSNVKDTYLIWRMPSHVKDATIFFCFLFLGSFLNSCDCSTAKSKTPPQETIFFTHLPIQSLGLNHPWPLVIENWFLF